MRKVIKLLLKRLFCRHKYEFFASLSYRERSTNKRFYEITVKCSKCQKEKTFETFSTSDNNSRS